MSETEKDDPVFAHPIEEEFAKLLDYYGIEWQYEPRTFVLARDDDGNATNAFTPDFYTGVITMVEYTIIFLIMGIIIANRRKME